MNFTRPLCHLSLVIASRPTHMSRTTAVKPFTIRKSLNKHPVLGGALRAGDSSMSQADPISALRDELFREVRVGRAVDTQ